MAILRRPAHDPRRLSSTAACYFRRPLIGATVQRPGRHFSALRRPQVPAGREEVAPRRLRLPSRGALMAILRRPAHDPRRLSSTAACYFRRPLIGATVPRPDRHFSALRRPQGSTGASSWRAALLRPIGAQFPGLATRALTLRRLSPTAACYFGRPMAITALQRPGRHLACVATVVACPRNSAGTTRYCCRAWRTSRILAAAPVSDGRTLSGRAALDRGCHGSREAVILVRDAGSGSAVRSRGSTDGSRPARHIRQKLSTMMPGRLAAGRPCWRAPTSSGCTHGKEPRGAVSHRARQARTARAARPRRCLRLSGPQGGGRAKHEGRRRHQRVAGQALCRGQARAAGRAAGHRHLRQGRHHPACVQPDGPAGGRRHVVPAAERGGAGARFPLARASGLPAPRRHRHLQPVAL